MDGDNANNANSNQDNAQNTTGQTNNASTGNTNNVSAGNTNINQNSNGAIDYSKIEQIIEGRNAKTEDAVLKSYFQKQGLSEDEMQSAIESFKTSKAQKALEQNQNVANLQNENVVLKEKIQTMEINSQANQVALELGVDAKTIPYLVKMADLTGVVDSQGKISSDAIKTALNTVLEALPQLKTNASSEDGKGFSKIGGRK